MIQTIEAQLARHHAARVVPICGCCDEPLGANWDDCPDCHDWAETARRRSPWACVSASEEWDLDPRGLS